MRLPARGIITLPVSAVVSHTLRCRSCYRQLGVGHVGDVVCPPRSSLGLGVLYVVRIAVSDGRHLDSLWRCGAPGLHSISTLATVVVVSESTHIWRDARRVDTPWCRLD